MSFKRRRVTVDFDPVNEPSLTKQSFKDDCDIDTIVSRYIGVGGSINSLPDFRPDAVDNLDLPTVSSYHEAMNVVAEANNAFSNVPAKVRRRFDNDPAQFVDFVSNPENFDECVKLGLATPIAKTQAVPDVDEVIGEKDSA